MTRLERGQKYSEDSQIPLRYLGVRFQLNGESERITCQLSQSGCDNPTICSSMFEHQSLSIRWSDMVLELLVIFLQETSYVVGDGLICFSIKFLRIQPLTLSPLLQLYYRLERYNHLFSVFIQLRKLQFYIQINANYITKISSVVVRREH